MRTDAPPILAITHLAPEEVGFTLFGQHPAFLNALRRALLGWAPTMAIEKVFISRNDSVVPDEMLAHRLGLIPIRADPRRFVYRCGDDSHTDEDTVVFHLSVACGADEPPDHRRPVMSGDLVWAPQGDQATTLADDPVRVADPAIPITILRRGEALEVTAYCEKGIGSDHAKWSPVAAAYYRFAPASDSPSGADVLDCTLCREHLQHPDPEPSLEDAQGGRPVHLDGGRAIFTVESVGGITAADAVVSAYEELIRHTEEVRELIRKARESQVVGTS